MAFVRLLAILLLVLPTTSTYSYGTTNTSSTSAELADEQDSAVAGRHGNQPRVKRQKDDLNTTCPTWTFPTANDTCKCGISYSGVVKCDQETLNSTVLGCYCVTRDTSQKKVVVGSCLYGCKYYPTYPVPPNVSTLNHVLCQGDKRSGQLCGGCQDGHAPPVYSYLLSCVPCSEGESNIGRYLAVALVPLTVFFIAIVASGFSATAASMNAFIFVSQIVTSPALMRIAEAQFTRTQISHSMVNGFNAAASVYGVWNLDFFRVLYKPFCLHHRMNTLQVLAMDYIVAIYPMALTVAVYFLVKLYDRKFKLIVWLWKPFHWFLLGFKTQWNIRTSLIDTFATFLLLSWVKLLFVSADILTYTHIAGMYGNPEGIFLYFDGTVEYFGAHHIPYAVLAIVVVFFFVFLPSMLLCLYPCRCFQRLLNRFRLRCVVLHTFMDAFQGCYKDGTNGTRDCRYFAGGYLWVRILLVLMYCLITGPILYSVAILILTIQTAMFVIAKPYKRAIFNVTDQLVIIPLIVGYVAVLSTATQISHIQYGYMEGAITVCFLIPLLYLLAVTFHRFLVKTGLLHRIHHKVLLVISRKLKWSTLEESLPDRLIHAGEYEALLPQPVADRMNSAQ